MKKYLILIFFCFPLHAMNINLMHNIFYNHSSGLSSDSNSYKKKELRKKNYCQSSDDKKLCVLVNERKYSLSKLRVTKIACNDLLKESVVPEQCITYNKNSMYDLVVDWSKNYPNVQYPKNCDC